MSEIPVSPYGVSNLKAPEPMPSLRVTYDSAYKYACQQQELIDIVRSKLNMLGYCPSPEGNITNDRDNKDRESPSNMVEHLSALADKLLRNNMGLENCIRHLNSLV